MANVGFTFVDAAHNPKGAATAISQLRNDVMTNKGHTVVVDPLAGGGSGLCFVMLNAAGTALVCNTSGAGNNWETEWPNVCVNFEAVSLGEDYTTAATSKVATVASFTSQYVLQQFRPGDTVFVVDRSAAETTHECTVDAVNPRQRQITLTGSGAQAFVAGDLILKPNLSAADLLSLRLPSDGSTTLAGNGQGSVKGAEGESAVGSQQFAHVMALVRDELSYNGKLAVNAGSSTTSVKLKAASAFGKAPTANVFEGTYRIRFTSGANDGFSAMVDASDNAAQCTFDLIDIRNTLGERVTALPGVPADDDTFDVVFDGFGPYLDELLASPKGPIPASGVTAAKQFIMDLRAGNTAGLNSNSAWGHAVSVAMIRAIEVMSKSVVTSNASKFVPFAIEQKLLGRPTSDLKGMARYVIKTGGAAAITELTLDPGPNKSVVNMPLAGTGEILNLQSGVGSTYGSPAVTVDHAGGSTYTWTREKNSNKITLGQATAGTTSSGMVFQLLSGTPRQEGSAPEPSVSAKDAVIMLDQVVQMAREFINWDTSS